MRKHKSHTSRAVRIKATPRNPSAARSPPLHPSPAVDAVFATQELFEDIMLRLSMKQLLTAAQCVSKSWKRSIDNSSPLQRRLFFRPDTTKTLEETQGDCVVNPLLRRHFGLMLGRKEDQDGGDDAGWQAMAMRDRRGFLEISTLQRMKLSITDMTRGRARHERFVRAGATWRRMLISQPSPRNVGYIEYAENGESRRYWDAPFDVVTIPDGLRMGMLWDTIYRTLWSPYGKNVERRRAFVSWRMRWEKETEEEGMTQPDSWTSEKLPYRLRSRDMDVDLIVGYAEAIVDEQYCYKYHNHSIKDGKYKCRDEHSRFIAKRTRGSTSWAFRSEDFNEKNTLAKVAGDCTRVRYDRDSRR